METNKNYPICFSTYDNIDLLQGKHPCEIKFCSKWFILNENCPRQNISSVCQNWNLFASCAV